MKSTKIKILKILLLLVAISLTAASARGGQFTDDEQRALRDAVQARYDVVPLSDGVALRPKTRTKDVRLIEIADGSIVINGTTVTGRELRERLGADADAIVRLSYLSTEESRALFEKSPEPVEPVEPSRSDVERTPGAEVDEPRRVRSSRDRVRVFGNLTVDRDEEINGDVVAVFGSVKVDGVVRQEVVSVFGSVDLGPEAVVGGDVVAVGGRVRRAATARTRSGVTEISLGTISIGDPDFRMHVPPWFRGFGGPFYWLGGDFGAVPRLVGSIMRFGLILLVAGIALLIARPAVEGAAQRVSDEPLKATLVGLSAQLLIIPVLLLTALLLVVTVIGIPLIALLPFVVLFLVLLAIVGFTGTAAAVGSWLLRRMGTATAPPFVEVTLGVLVLLSPLLLGRMLAVAGWTLSPIAVLFVSLGFIVELLAWSSGFGAALSNSYARWRARRAIRRNGSTPTVTPTPT
jgi:hypothetical protein